MIVPDISRAQPPTSPTGSSFDAALDTRFNQSQTICRIPALKHTDAQCEAALDQFEGAWTRLENARAVRDTGSSQSLTEFKATLAECVADMINAIQTLRSGDCKDYLIRNGISLEQLERKLRRALNEEASRIPGGTSWNFDLPEGGLNLQAIGSFLLFLLSLPFGGQRQPI